MHFFRLLATLLSASFALATPAWLKVCGLDSKVSYFVHAGGCPRGFKLNQSVPVTCVCVNGVWSLSQGECDRRPYLLVGNGHCFALEESQISNFKFIGRQSVPFAPATLIGSQFFDAFWDIPSGKIKDSSNATMVILHINSDKVATAMETACCSPDPLRAHKPVHICFGVPPAEYSLRSYCFDSAAPLLELDHLVLDYGEGIRLGSSDGEQQLLTSTSVCAKCASKEKFHYETDCCSALQFEDASDFVSVDVKRYDKQTNRLVGAYLDFTLKKKKLYQLKTYEYQQLRMGSAILGKVCPADTVPAELLKIVLRLFKQVVNESMEEFVIERTVDEIHHERIMSVLKTCSASAKRWKVYRNPTACDEAIIETREDLKIVSVMPEPEKYDAEKLDFVLESVWKIILFTYYYCFKFFRDTPSDAAFLLKGLERFFTPDLIRRWRNVGNSFSVFKFLLPTFNLHKFSWTLDACVIGGKAISEVKQWLPRPYLRYQSNYMERSSSSIWNESGTCLGSYWYPMDSYEDSCSDPGPVASENQV